nr:MAG TPA: hypothetical protein [Caudoviricetes sp.]DAS91486.1 MAG TPA: hypothetical protein [Caudoviricetes sp.]
MLCDIGEWELSSSLRNCAASLVDSNDPLLVISPRQAYERA